MKIKSRILFFAALILVLPVVGILYFFYSSDAPITHGELSYNVRYFENKSLDVYHPTKRKYEKSPVLLFIHGGAWIAGRKEAVNLNRFNGAFNVLRENGYAIVSPEYTLAKDGKSPFPDCIKDGFHAIEWIKDNADSLQFDLDNFGIMGESAGGQIAMMNSYVSPELFGLSYEKFTPDYLINIYGPNDLMDLYHSRTIDSLEQIIHQLPEAFQTHFDLPKLLFGFDPMKDSARTVAFTNKFSPIHHLNATSKITTLIIHGTEDQLVPIQQSVNLKEAIEVLDIPVELRILEGVNHAFAGASPAQKDSVQQWIADFVINNY